MLNKTSMTLSTSLVTLLLAQQAYAVLANQTPIATPDGSKGIETFVVGDQVLTYSASASGVAAQPSAVSFSSGTQPASPAATMVFVQFDDQTSLIVTPDQPLMLEGGKLQRADRIIPANSVMTASGGTKRVVMVSQGMFNRGLHSIATGSTSPLTDPQNHLINANGILVGDFFVQIYFSQLPDQYRVTQPNFPGPTNPYFSEYMR